MFCKCGLMCYLLFLSVFFAVFDSYGASNAFVTVNAVDADVKCVGLDFIVIPKDLFGAASVSVSVCANIGWILLSSPSINIAPGEEGDWRVKGDEDNPEDWAAGKIYVAKVEVGLDEIELMRGSSVEVRFSVLPEDAVQFITFATKVKGGYNPLMTTGSQVLRSLSDESVSASVCVEDELITIDNKIERDRVLSGDDVAKVEFSANSSSVLITTRLKKDVYDLWSKIKDDLEDLSLKIVSPAENIKWIVSRDLRNSVSYAGLSIEERPVYDEAINKVADYVFSMSDNLTKRCLSRVSVDFDQCVKPNSVVDESWTWFVSPVFDVSLAGGDLKFSKGFQSSVANFVHSVCYKGKFDKSVFQVAGERVGVTFGANGNTASGVWKTSMTLTIDVSSVFKDGSIDNVGNFSWSGSLVFQVTF